MTMLRLVPDPDETGPEEPDLGYVPHLADEHEQQLIGALMYLAADAAQDILNLVPDKAFHDTTGRWAYQLIRSIVGDGQDVDPVNILVAGRRRGAEASPRTPTPHQQHQLALYLVDASTRTSTAGNPASCAQAVLDNASRRGHPAAAAAPHHLTAAVNTEERSRP